MSKCFNNNILHVLSFIFYSNILTITIPLHLYNDNNTIYEEWFFCINNIIDRQPHNFAQTSSQIKDRIYCYTNFEALLLNVNTVFLYI